jgi:hypothetical protein
VWIDSRGKNPRRWVFLDGQRVEGEISDTRIAVDGVVLELALIATLENRVLGDIINRVPGVSGIAPRAVRDVREQKWLSRGELRSGDTRLTGRAIHETAIFP